MYQIIILLCGSAVEW